MEYKFVAIGNDMYGALITERIEIPLENMADIVVQNARSAAPDARLIAQEYRVVNGKKVMMTQTSGTISGIEFTYFSYCYSSSDGTTQLVVYTSKKLAEQYQKDAEEFLNGLTL